MKTRLLYFAFFCVLFSHPFTGKTQAVNTQDSLALVDLYNSTNGPGWINHTNWLTAAPVNSWFGVTVENQRVVWIQFANNKLVGTIPVSVATLSQLQILDFSQNQLTGTIPSSLGGLTGIFSLDLSNNQLSGTLPSSLGDGGLYAIVRLDHNQFTFSGMEYLVNRRATHIYYPSFNPQSDLPLLRNGNILSVAAGGTLSKNTYKWYKDNTLLATITGDSTYTINSEGNYSVEVSNSIVTTNPIIHGPDIELTLFSTSIPDIQDSLALVDLYNNTNGPGWINSHNWLTSAPLSSWYGVTVRRGRVTQLVLPENKLSGLLTASLGNLTSITLINLYKNQLTGNLPASIGNLTYLKSLGLSANQLTGSIPNEWSNLHSLEGLGMSDNMLSGDIPSYIGDFSSLRGLFLNNNRFSGTIPSTLGRLSKLQQIFLSDNQLSGSIPDSLLNCNALIQLVIGNNQLSGIISDSIFKLRNLGRFDIHNNQFTGKIPDSMGAARQLFNLDFSGNNLSGVLPQSLKGLFLSGFQIQDNKFTFLAAESISLVSTDNKIYAPQKSIPLHRNGNLFSVSAGGTLANNTYKLYKGGVLTDTKTADSSFAVTLPGQYYMTVTNSVATQLTLFTDTITVDGLRLTDSTSATLQTISGINPVNVVDTPYQSLLLTVTPTPGLNPLSGEVNFKVTIDPAVISFKNQPYVQRHYDITPVSNAAAAQATVKLYFTQQDFDNFNAAPAHGLNLPSAPTDAAGITNLRVYQYHGFSTTSLPGSYSGNAVEIDPLDANIVWNSAAQYWEVNFDVSGFSGFFVSSQNNALLPVRLVSFTGNRQRKETLLQWTSASELNTHYFEVQRSADGNSFTSIGMLRAAGNSASSINYAFSDITETATVDFYRLKMIDIDGRFAYSKVIKLSLATAAPAFTLYPNPASDFVVVNLPDITTGLSTLQLTDIAGRTIQTFILPAGVQQTRLSLKAVPVGVYRMVYLNAGRTTASTLLIR